MDFIIVEENGQNSGGRVFMYVDVLEMEGSL